MEELKKYEEPEMEIKFLDWSDIVTASTLTNVGEVPGTTNDTGFNPAGETYEEIP